LRPSEPAEPAPSETAGSGVGLSAVSAGRRAVLAAIKQAGEASAEQLAGDIGVTAGAVRQQIAALEAEGLVAHRDERPGPGRPRRQYCLTPAAEALWPKRYGQLANQVLGFVEADGPDLVERIFERRRDDRLKRAESRLHGLSFANRVRELTGILEEDGYLAESVLAEDGSWLVIEHNCAILDVARRYGAACTSDLAFPKAALPAQGGTRVSHNTVADFVCAYRMRARVAYAAHA